MMQVIRYVKSLACISLFMVPLSFFEQVATWTKKFCYKDWVVEKFASNQDGNQKKRRHFVEVPAKTGRNITPGRRHRADKEKTIHCDSRIRFVLDCDANLAGRTI